MPVKSRYASSIDAISTLGEKRFSTSYTLREYSRYRQRMARHEDRHEGTAGRPSAAA